MSKDGARPPTETGRAAQPGEMRRLVSALDWGATPLGPAAKWPQGLKTAVQIMLDSRYAMWLGWGPELTFFYNDAYAKMTLGSKHPWALGRRTREVWPEIWGDVGPRAESVIRTGEATWDEGLLLFLERRGFPEETYHTFSYSPLPDDSGGVGGMLCVVTEDTERTIGERRLRTLREIAAQTADQARSAEEACRRASQILGSNPYDLPFVLLYLLDENQRWVTLAGATGISPDSPASPTLLEIGADPSPWPFLPVVESGRAIVVEGVENRLDGAAPGVWPEAPRRAVVLPMAKPGQAQLAGFVVAGVSARRPLDDGYNGFLDLLAGQIATAVANARAYELERQRAEALAELDRAKTTFFSNVSHEFRTPLTLMLGPVEEMLAEPEGQVSAQNRELLDVVRRNGLRLQKLVNTLLDFSRIEAGRIQASYEPTDLPRFTAELASFFRSACERAGLELKVDCPPVPEPVYVDREMWEKVVFNLLSNAFKFTWEGEIELRLGVDGDEVELMVRDTGVGMPPEEIPKLFERFHRTEGARGRTQEGSGIGLALVRELVELHSGDIRAESELGKGTAFFVRIPLGSDHLPADRVGAPRMTVSTSVGARPFVEEALRWIPNARDVSTTPVASDEELTITTSGAARPRVLVADDNADMLSYICRLLRERHDVVAVRDGLAALEAVRNEPPDLILSDVMMPGLDGFGLLRQVRADASIRELPVVLLSARAGEEARVEGLQAGADDYLTKPFSAKELLAHVSAQLALAKARREAAEALRESETRFRNMADNAPVMIWVTEPSGHCTYLNKQWYAFTGLGPEQALGFGWVEAIYPDDRERAREAFTTAKEKQEGFRSECRLRRFDGEYCSVIDSAAPRFGHDGEFLGYIGSVMDITDLKRVEGDRQKLVALAENSTDFIAMCDRDFAPFFVNRAGLEMVGLDDMDQARRVHVRDFFFPEDQDSVLRQFVPAVLKTGSGELEVRFRHFKTGAALWMLYRVFVLKAENGEIAGLATVSRDITERKRLEDDLRKLAADLSEADRRKDEFLATLAHELRNPLAPIRSGLNLLSTAKDEPYTVETVCTTMERQVQQMVRLIDDLMDVSRITRGKLELRKREVQLGDIVQSAVEAARPFIEEAKHDLRVRIPEERILLEADPNRLAQVLSNLLNNAAKYTPEGGRVVLTVERETTEAIVRVKDSGIGIPADSLESVFEMFTQVDRPQEKGYMGLGIGLTLCKTLVEMHGGRVYAHSEGVGQGSEFTVRLPLLEDSRREPPARTIPEQTRDRAPRRILIVDDNKAAAEMLAMVVEALGDKTRTAHDGKEAVDAAAVFLPDIVLMDIGMPKMNGYEAAREIREQPWGKEMMLVALTGWGQDEDKMRTREAGFDYHLVKPAEPADLQRLFAKMER